MKLDEIGLLCVALNESVKLQSHYATLLNMYDGGKRATFDNGAAWIARLVECKKIKYAEPASEDPSMAVDCWKKIQPHGDGMA